MPSDNAPSRMGKEELIAELSESYKGEDLQDKTRPELVRLVKDLRAQKAAYAALERAEEVPEPAGVATAQGGPQDANTAPHPHDKEWTQHVMGRFAEDELDGQNPRVDGLRRVAEDLIGPIVEEGAALLDAPKAENAWRACVKAWVVFEGHDGNRKRFEALADVNPDNCDPTFAKFPTSTAETRAKGRCFRMALHLKRVIAAEEADTEIPLNTEAGADTNVSVGQVSVIQIMADRLNVSIIKLLNHLEIKKSDLKALTATEGLLVAKHLNALQSTGAIPPSLLRGGKNGE